MACKGSGVRVSYPPPVVKARENAGFFIAPFKGLQTSSKVPCSRSLACATVTVREWQAREILEAMDAPVQDSVDFDHFVDDLEMLIPMLIPGVRLVREASGLMVTRSRADIAIQRKSWSECAIVMRFDGTRVLSTTTSLVPSAIADLRADMIGFLCGAPIRSFSIWPHSGPKPELKTRRARRRPELRLATWWSRERSDAG